PVFDPGGLELELLSALTLVGLHGDAVEPHDAAGERAVHLLDDACEMITEGHAVSRLRSGSRAGIVGAHDGSAVLASHAAALAGSEVAERTGGNRSLIDLDGVADSIGRDRPA